MLLVLTSCSEKPEDKGPYPIPIMGIQMKGTLLALGVAACNDAPEQVMVNETKDEVRLAASSANKESKGDCANGVTALLGSVIGPRRVVDDYNGATLQCSVKSCWRAGGSQAIRPAQVRSLRPYTPRKPGSASLPWDSPVWHPEDKFLDISYFPGCHNTVYVELREDAKRVRLRVIRDVLRSTTPCGMDVVARVPLSAPIGDRQILHDKVDGAQMPPPVHGASPFVS